MTTDYSDPAEWDTIPTPLGDAIKAALAEYGWTVLDIHDDGIVIDVPGLAEDEEWVLRRPGWRGDHWLYGIYTRGVCPYPTPLAAEPTDAAGIAAEAAAILSGYNRNEACGENSCRCYGAGSIGHEDCACGCDCPRDANGQLIHEG